MRLGVGMEYWLKVLVGIHGIVGVSTKGSYNTAVGVMRRLGKNRLKD